VNALRARQQRNFLLTLFLAQGVPMLVGGDELGRTQGGNNNAWCQDNETSWFDWEHVDEPLYEFTRRLIRMRREHPVFRRPRFLTGRGRPGADLPDVWWMRPDGRRMTQRDWTRGNWQSLGVFLNGDELAAVDAHGEEIHDESFLILLNASHEPVTFKLPTRRFGPGWTFVVSSSEPEREEGSLDFPARSLLDVEARSTVVLRLERRR
jgi:isoamylase